MKEKILKIITATIIKILAFVICIYIFNKIGLILETNLYIAINPWTVMLMVVLGIPGIIGMILVQML